MTNLSAEISDPLAALAAALGALRACVKEAFAEAVRQERRAFVEAEPVLAARFAEINAKVNITVPEGALLLGCSDSHLYRLIGEAEKGKSKRPIPYLDLDGVKVLPREQLLEWARPRHQRAVAGREAAANLAAGATPGVHSAPDFRRSRGTKGVLA